MGNEAIKLVPGSIRDSQVLSLQASYLSFLSFAHLEIHSSSARLLSQKRKSSSSSQTFPLIFFLPDRIQFEVNQLQTENLILKAKMDYLKRKEI